MQTGLTAFYLKSLPLPNIVWHLSKYIPILQVNLRWYAKSQKYHRSSTQMYGEIGRKNPLFLELWTAAVSLQLGIET